MVIRNAELFAVTVYMLEGRLNVNRQIRESYRSKEDFNISDVSVAGRDGVLLKGSIPKERTNWSVPLGEWIDDPALATIGQSTAAALLLLPAKDASKNTWALSFGMGLHALEQSRIISGLGRKIAVRQADPDHLKSVTHSRLDQRALVARTSIPGGDDLAAYGVGGIADLISRVVAPADLEGMHARSVRGDKTIEIRGADAIKLPLARDPKLLLKDLDTLESLLLLDPHSRLSEIEQLQAVKKADTRWKLLQQSLDSALGTAGQDDLGLSWPTESADAAVPISHFRITGAPRGFNNDDEREPSLQTLLEPLVELPPGRRVERLDSMKVQAFSDDDEAASPLLPAKRWIVFETSLPGDGGRYCLHDGRWYELDRQLNDRLTERTRLIFDRDSPLQSLPAWAAGHEADYNDEIAKTLGGVNLDAKLIKCESNRDGFEACDVLTRDQVFIHVKNVDRSSPLSHLLAQAAVSTQTLLQDVSAREALRTRVEIAGGDPSWVPDRPRKVVLVMCRDREINAETLYAFSRMRLVNLAEEFELWNVDLSVQWVERTA
ncbi:DUF6119 family protein [Arthrobacter citreus]|uniref:DUF6119 family protein n=1 Tax=Arthrobacter citreus TaxID=1670 RepID=UPI00147818DA|nr:DUF6119 family protein [Arthrobacter citreus]